MELHVALSMRHDAVEAYRLAHAYRDEVLAEDQATPLVVSRFDVAMEPAPEEEPVLTVGAIAEDGRPVALLFDEETRRKVAGWLAPADDGEEATAAAATATPTDTTFDPLPSYLHAIGHAGSETERGLYAAYVQAIAEVVRLQAATATATGPTCRVAQLLDAIRTTRGRWTTTRAAQFYRNAHIEPPGAQWSRTRTVARGDLRDLAAWGHLLRHEEPGRQFYTLSSRKAVSS
jgi:hypothetical protein